MELASTLKVLESHRTTHADEAAFLQQTLDFVHQYPDLFWQRANESGHLTGSAWVLSPDRQQVLLIHHKALDRWFQPGGHADDTDAGLLETALREAMEESGLTQLTPIASSLFDLDIHPIPAKPGVPAHLHYDLRFVFVADNPTLPEAMNELEIKNIRWVPVRDLLSADISRSIQRMAEKSV
jgi:8-oxo-dGTP pyrophosphatase MutT (NUDIX family)